MIALIPAILLAAVAIGLLIVRQRSLVNELNEVTVIEVDHRGCDCVFKRHIA